MLRQTKPLAGRTARRGSGFTLIEMLTVVVIIGILAGLVTAAVISAKTTARNAAIRIEIGALETALKAYYSQFSEYPPDTAGAAALDHWKARFPNAAPPAELGNLNPTTAMVYWLAGPAGKGFKGPGMNDPPFFEFKPERLVGLVYYPDLGTGSKKCPYVYLRAPYGQPAQANGESVKPYKDTRSNNDYANANSFQIISAGLDEKYGAADSFPPCADAASADNVTNFVNMTVGKEK